MMKKLSLSHALAIAGASLLACVSTVQAQQSQAQKTPAQKQEAQQRKAERAKAETAPLAISDTHTQELLQSFSSSRTVNSQKSGSQIYAAICQGCHMPQGEGAKGAGFYPPLDSSNLRMSAATYPAVVILRGMHGMPAFASRLDDAQVAEVVNYVRSNFGNNYTDKISAQDVSPLRGTVAPN